VRSGNALNATRADVGGKNVVLAYGSVAVEYESLHSNAALFDRSHRGRIRVNGDKAAEMVAGLVTNDVAGLVPGQGCYAAALTAKGKIVADGRAADEIETKRSAIEGPIETLIAPYRTKLREDRIAMLPVDVQAIIRKPEPRRSAAEQKIAAAPSRARDVSGQDHAQRLRNRNLTDARL